MWNHDKNVYSATWWHVLHGPSWLHLIKSIRIYLTVRVLPDTDGYFKLISLIFSGPLCNVLTSTVRRGEAIGTGADVGPDAVTSIETGWLTHS